MRELSSKISSAGISTHLAQAASWLAAEHKGIDKGFIGVSTDTRTMKPGVLFVALRGPNFDAHEHIREAEAKGAAALLVERVVDSTLPQLIVVDTRRALGRLAAAWRQHCNTPLIAITGSNGKTTVKEMCRVICSQVGETLATEGNLNNEIGVPLSLLRLAPEHRYAVIEMGASKPGEIAYLTDLTQPDVAVITNVGPAHLTGFGAVEDVARAKGEIYAGLRENGVAVINADGVYTDLWREMAGTHRQSYFGAAAESDITAQWRPTATGTQVDLQTPAGKAEILLPLPGEHNVMNALAATAACLALGIDLTAICNGLAQIRGVAGRLTISVTDNGVRLIDDSYNANPSSMRAAIDVLAAYPAPRILVVGDMGELGVNAVQLHRETGLYAKAAGIDALYAIGELSQAVVDAFGSGAKHFTDREMLLADLQQELGAQVTVLVKGSRSAQMELVVAAISGGGR